MSDATRRFTDRVEDYVRFRPGYPDAMLEVLRSSATLSAASAVADIGSGTGISTELLLRTGATVYAVEPNAAMRAAAEQQLGHDAQFHSVDGSAEATGLDAGSVDLVVAGQAFHWFSRDDARREFTRILKPGGLVGLFWNSRLTDATSFLREYEALLQRFGTDYQQVNHQQVDSAAMAAFFGGSVRRYSFPNAQTFDLEGLTGRLLSSSYAPAPGHRHHAPMLCALWKIFQEHEEGGSVRFLYETELYLGRLPG